LVLAKPFVGAEERDIPQMQKWVVLAVCTRLMQRAVCMVCPSGAPGSEGWSGGGWTLACSISREHLSVLCDWVLPNPCAVAWVMRNESQDGAAAAGSSPTISRCTELLSLGEVVFSQRWLVPPGTHCPGLTLC